MINEGCHTASSEATNLVGDANSSLKKPSVQPCYRTEMNISEDIDLPGLVDLHSSFIVSTRNHGRLYSLTTSFIWNALRENRGGFQNTVNPVKPQRIVQSYLPTPKTYCETYCETCETDETYSAPSKPLVEPLFTGFIGFIEGFILEYCTERYCTTENLKVSQVSQLNYNVKRFDNNE